MSAANDELREVVVAALPREGELRILEAGCGSKSHLNLPEQALVTGIDVSESQLERNSELTEKILGDLQTHHWPADSFDLVVCWDVLEHLEQPGDAIARMAEGLRSGGLMVLALPNLMSLKGLVTKFTPFWVHVAFYKYALGDSDATSQADRYRTFLKRECAPNSIVAQARREGLSVLHFRLYEGPVQVSLRRRYRPARWALDVLSWTSRFLSFGKLDLSHSDGIIVLQRPAR